MPGITQRMLTKQLRALEDDRLIVRTVYAEVHKDIYGYTPALYRDAVAELERRGLSNNVDQRRLEDAIAASTGVPVPISPDPDSVLTRPVTPDTTTAERRADEDVH